MRLHVLKVIQLSRRHLNKLTNSDEFLKRINAVTHSNDAVARAVVLRWKESIFSNFYFVILEFLAVLQPLYQKGKMSITGLFILYCCYGTHINGWSAFTEGLNPMTWLKWRQRFLLWIVSANTPSV